MVQTSPARYLTLAQVAELLNIEVDEVIQLLQQRRLLGARLGSPPSWRVERDSVQTYVEEQLEETRRMALWRESNEASFPELWSSQKLT